MQKFSLIQKVGFSWYKTFDTDGSYFSFLKSVSPLFRFIIYALYVAALGSAIWFVVSLLIAFTFDDPIINFFLQSIGAVIMILGGRVIFLESLMCFELSDLKIIATQKSERTFFFGKMSFLLRGLSYFLVWLSLALLLAYAALTSMVMSLDSDFHAALQNEQLLTACDEVFISVEISFTFFFLLFVIGYEIYNNKKNKASA